MSIDYDAVSRLSGLSKGTPIRTQIERAKAEWQKVDARESRNVRQRSGGQCEVRVGNIRCLKRAVEVHHHMGGYGVRGRGESAKARHKTHACSGCHGLITSRRLQHIQGHHYRVRT